MKLEQQVCSLDLAKRLKELGVKQESLFYWQYHTRKTINDDGWDLHIKEGCPYVSLIMKESYDARKWINDEKISAFTVAELGEIMKDKGMGVTAHSSLINEWWIRGGIYDFGKHQYNHIETDVKWSDCLAKMLVYLLENKLITL